jgi:hypothetical protein
METKKTKTSRVEAAKPSVKTTENGEKPKSAVTLFWEKLEARGGAGVIYMDMRAVLK